MAVLKKTKGATLIENLVSMVLLIIIFLLVSTTIQHFFFVSMQLDEHELKVKFDREFYFFEQDKIELSKNHEYKKWILEYRIELKGEMRFFVLRATHSLNKKTILFEHVLEK